MPIIKTFAQASSKLSNALHAVSVPDLPYLPASLFSMTLSARSPITATLLPAQHCPECQTKLGDANELYNRVGVCDVCGYHFVYSASNRVAQLADGGSFRPIGHAIEPEDFLDFADELPYAARLLRSQQQTGLHDAILVGRCRIGNTETVLAVLDFRFMGGSMGSVVGESITVAFEYARKHHLPVVSVVNSGGARMQEGIISLMQMPKTAAAVQHFHESGLLYVSILASPTTGGVFASFASLGDVMIAEPKAIIGFAGPRVAEQATGRKLATGSHRAETLLIAGQLDAIVARQDLPQVVSSLLKATVAQPKQRHAHSRHTSTLTLADAPGNAAWESVQLARHPQRPTAQEYISYLSPNFFELQGDRCYGNDPTVVTGLGEIDGHPVLFVGQERRHVVEHSEEEMQTRPRPEGYRKAIRMMNLAAQLHCPLVTFVDTTGADPGDESEQHGIAWSLAHCLSTMSSLPVPIVTVIIGEGASGGAVALAVADYVLMLQNAIYEVIAPEGAATILYRDAQKARQVAEQLKLTAFDCLKLGIIDGIIPEPQEGAHVDPPVVMQAVEQYVLDAITKLAQVPEKQLLARRYRKFRHYGRFQRKQYLLLRTSISTSKQWSSVLHQFQHRHSGAISSRVSALITHFVGHWHGLAS